MTVFTARPANTIAILPFVNMSSDTEYEYFSDGMTEEIITAVSRLKNIRVTSRTSSFFYKNKNLPIQQIGQELGVAIILEGSVRRSGDTLRITAQLIEAENDYHFWSATWDKKFENIFEIQDEISLNIAERIREQWGHFDINESLVTPQTLHFTAYDLSLKAKYQLNQWNAEQVTQAIDLYKKALAIDPNHVESLAGLADAYSFMATAGFMPPDETWSKVIQLIEQAQKLNKDLPAVNYQISQLAFFTESNYTQALDYMHRAILHQPNYVEAQQFMSFLYLIAGHKKLAQQHLKIALQLDPHSPETLFFQGYYTYMTNDYSEALQIFAQCLSFNPNNLPAHSVTCYCYLKMGQPEKCLSYLDQLDSHLMVDGDRLGLTGIAYALLNNIDQTQRCLNQLTATIDTEDGFRAYSYLIMIYAQLNQIDTAFEWLDKGLAQKRSLLLFHFADPLCAPLQKDPRYPAYHERLYAIPSNIQEEHQPKQWLSLTEKEEYRDQLHQIMISEKPFLDTQLSLKSLAKKIQLHPNQLSYLLNDQIGQNFNEYINHYRLQHFLTTALEPQNQHLSVMSMAYDSGFNSKSVFNTYFKKSLHTTPSQYLRKMRKKKADSTSPPDTSSQL